MQKKKKFKSDVWVWERKPFEMSSSIRSSTSGLKRSPERSDEATRPCRYLSDGEATGGDDAVQNGERSAPALQEAGCHGDGNKHVEHAGLRQNAGSRRSGGGGVRRCGVRVGRQGVVRVHRLVSRQRGGVDRRHRVLG